MSSASIAIAILLKALAPGYATEYRFHPTRKWRFDYAIPKLKVGVEYEGVRSAKSRHTTFVGFSNDCEKYSEAAILGWCVVRVTAKMIGDGRAANLIRKALERGER